MRIATISPVPLLKWSRTSNIHLILPELCYRSEYIAYVKEMKARGDYIILDNGAAEGQVPTWPKLVQLAIEFEVDELVVPDVMLDAATTAEMARVFRGHAMEIKSSLPNVKFAGVVQGRNTQDWQRLLLEYLNGVLMDYISVYHFPRCMNWQYHNQRVRFLEAMWHSGWLPAEAQVHCLGASDWIKEVVALAALPIRSMDTSKPVVFGLARHEIEFHPEDIQRQDDFFNLTADLVQEEYIDHNVFTYYGWAGFNPLATPSGQVP